MRRTAPLGFVMGGMALVAVGFPFTLLVLEAGSRCLEANEALPPP